MSASILTEILSELRCELEKVIGADLVEIILYGSLARGDFDSESDVDIAVIVNRDRTELKKYQKNTISLISELCLNYDTLISVNYIPFTEFEEYKSVLPYYRNIDCEGVRVGACQKNVEFMIKTDNDYTEWQHGLWNEKSIEEIHAAATAYEKSNK